MSLSHRRTVSMQVQRVGKTCIAGRVFKCQTLCDRRRLHGKLGGYTIGNNVEYQIGYLLFPWLE